MSLCLFWVVERGVGGGGAGGGEAGGGARGGMGGAGRGGGFRGEKMGFGRGVSWIPTLTRSFILSVRSRKWGNGESRLRVEKERLDGVPVGESWEWGWGRLHLLGCWGWGRLLMLGCWGRGRLLMLGCWGKLLMLG